MEYKDNSRASGYLSAGNGPKTPGEMIWMNIERKIWNHSINGIVK